MMTRTRGRVARALLALAALLVAAVPAPAQRDAAVLLRIGPPVGDTLRMRYEQDVSLTARSNGGESDSTVTMHSALLLLSHVLVQGRDETGTTITAVTDSVAVRTEGSAPLPETARRAMQGQRVQLHIAPDGAASVLAAPPAFGADVEAVVSGMPATLPRRPVRVGETWEALMRIPLGAHMTGPGARLHAVYRLDSLSVDGGLAYLSMHGTITREAISAPQRTGVRVATTGSVVARIRVDRRRGWWTDSEAIIVLRSAVTPVAGGLGRPMEVETRITQRMRSTGTP